MTNTEKIRALNDAFRTSLSGGRLMMTQGVVGRADIMTVLSHIKRFDAFDPGNDPHQEHDFGALEAGRDTIFWKIDYYGKDLASGSPDPADPAVTIRVMTVMLAEEY